MTEHRILEGDVLDCLRTLPDCSVQCCVTSPPYWGLRDYGVDGQIGLEKTPEEYVAKMVEVFREVRRVLRDDGTLWLNLGDSYAGSGRGPTGENGIQNAEERQGFTNGDPHGTRKNHTDAPSGFKAKDMIGIPWRVAFALQADGWYLRSDIIWAKRNCMPESVTDRPTKAHEYIFLMTKNARYFYDAEAIREPASDDRPRVEIRTFEQGMTGRNNGHCGIRKQDQTGNPTYTGFNERWQQKMARNGTNIKGHSGNFNANGEPICDGITRNKRTVWWINPQPRPEAHFATFPDELAETCIKAVSKIDDVVLDTFMGSGTVAVIARALNRSSIGIELNPEYVKIIRKRLQADSQLDTGVVQYRFEKIEPQPIYPPTTPQ